MPLRGQSHSSSVYDESPYFDSLDELDIWAASPAKKLNEVLKYYPSSRDNNVDGISRKTGKLLVCHDYKNGYIELQNPSAKWYTFNYWSACDTFVYFSHHRVTVPPSGWVTAAHRQGVKLLGTLIFEGSTTDVLRLITGPLPSSQSVSIQSDSTSSVALSCHYAQILADLAHQRGFDGYLLNFESTLTKGPEEGRALASWISILQSELQAKIGPHAQTVWYDSDIYTGSLQYQCKLDDKNVPFFIPSTGFFSDYHWGPTYPSDTVTYLNNLKPQDFGYVQTYEDEDFKTLRDVFMGVDVFGRYTWYKSGFGCHQALSKIDPANVELSVALFGPGWTWEGSDSDVLGKSWLDWFKYDRKLWVGPRDDETITLPSGDDGSYIPFTDFFIKNTPPNPATLAFYTSFCPGTGNRWYVNGHSVLDKTENGWTDVQKQTSLGDMLWPKPLVQWDGFVPNCDVYPTIDINHAWNGSSCVWLHFYRGWFPDQSLSFTPGQSYDNISGWVPIQSISLTPGQLYGATLICNDGLAVSEVGLKLSLSVKPLFPSVTEISTAYTEANKPSSDSNWTRLYTTFSASDLVSSDVLATIGLRFSYVLQSPDILQFPDVSTLGSHFSFSLAQMCIFPILPSPLDGSTIDSRILWADFKITVPSSPNTLPLGILNWDFTTSFLPSTRNDAKPPWTLTNPQSWLPRFVYFNIYAQPILGDGSVGAPDDAEFMGTTGLDGRANRFFVDTNVWPDDIIGSSKARMYVQGITDRGEVLSWDHCAYVDIELS